MAQKISNTIIIPLPQESRKEEMADTINRLSYAVKVLEERVDALERERKEMVSYRGGK
jgi:hypothetical protein